MNERIGFRLTIWNVNNFISPFAYPSDERFRLTIWNVNSHDY